MFTKMCTSRPMIKIQRELDVHEDSNAADLFFGDLRSSEDSPAGDLTDESFGYLSGSGSSCHGDEPKVEIQDHKSQNEIPDLNSQKIEIPHYQDLKSNNEMWESQPLYTRENFKYVLIVRPNGLKYTKSFKKSISISLKPVSSHRDHELNYPAEVTLTLRVGTTDGTNEGLCSGPKQCRWDREDTHSRYPVVAFEPTIMHSAVEKANCFQGENLPIVIEESMVQKVSNAATKAGLSATAPPTHA